MSLRTLRSVAVPMLVLVASVAASRAVSAQALGDVARQEEARRKAVKSGKVYTNDSLRSDSSTRSQPVATTPATPQADTPSAAAPAADPKTPSAPEGKKDETYWRERIKGEREALQRAEMFAEALQSRINALSADFTARDDPAQRSTIAADREKALAELDRVKKEIQDRTKAVSDIQAEARKAGAPAGWVR